MTRSQSRLSDIHCQEWLVCRHDQCKLLPEVSISSPLTAIHRALSSTWRDGSCQPRFNMRDFASRDSAPTPRRAKSHRGGAWGAGRQDRVEPADERDAGGDGAGAVPELVRGFRPRPRQTRRPPPRRPRPRHRRPLPRALGRLPARPHPERLDQERSSKVSISRWANRRPATPTTKKETACRSTKDEPTSVSVSDTPNLLLRADSLRQARRHARQRPGPVGDINMANEECCIGRGVAAVRHKSGATFIHLPLDGKPLSRLRALRGRRAPSSVPSTKTASRNSASSFRRTR